MGLKKNRSRISHMSIWALILGILVPPFLEFSQELWYSGTRSLAGIEVN